METRKAQLTGGSTFTVSLPKDWADEHGVEAGCEFHLFPRDDGSIIVEPKNGDAADWRTTVAIDDVPEAALERTLHAIYTAGFDEITLTTTPDYADRRRTVTASARQFVGLEVLDADDAAVTLRSLLDTTTVSVRQSVMQLEQVALSMHADAVTALVQQDADLAGHVRQRDDQADRLYRLVARQFERTLQSAKETETLDMTQPRLADHDTTARQLERIADHAEKISRLATRFEDPPDPAFADDIETQAAAARDAVERAVTAVLGDGVDAAYDALETRDAVVADLETIGRRLHERDVPESHLLALTLDSVTRTAEYGGNVAETALEYAARNEAL